MDSAMYFFGGAADLFLSVMLWFILEDRRLPTVLIDGDKVYAILDVIKESGSGTINDCEADEQEAGYEN